MSVDNDMNVLFYILLALALHHNLVQGLLFIESYEPQLVGIKISYNTNVRESIIWFETFESILNCSCITYTTSLALILVQRYREWTIVTM